MKKLFFSLSLVLALFVQAGEKSLTVSSSKLKSGIFSEKKKSLINTVVDGDDIENYGLDLSRKAYFSPGLKDVLCAFINNEKSCMKGAFFRFTLMKAAKCIERGIKERNMKVSLIVDESNIKEDFCSPLRHIIKSGGDVGARSGYGNMHHKFIIFKNNIDNKEILWTGSFNATGSADQYSNENVVIIENPEVIKSFKDQFKLIGRKVDVLEAKKCVSGTNKDLEPNLYLVSHKAREINGIDRVENTFYRVVDRFKKH